MSALLQGLSEAQLDVLGAAALGGKVCGRALVLDMLNAMQVQATGGKRYTTGDVKELMSELVQKGCLRELPGRLAHWSVADEVFSAAYLRLVDTRDVNVLRTALARAMKFDNFRSFPDLSAAIVIVRLALFTGMPYAEVEQFKGFCRWDMPWHDVVSQAILNVLDAALFERLPRQIQRDVLLSELDHVTTMWRPSVLPVAELAQRYLATHGSELELCVQLGEYFVGADRFDEANEMAKSLREARVFSASAQASSLALEAAEQVRRGRWADAELGYDLALTGLKSDSKKRKHLLPDLLAAAYVLALLAQQTPAHWHKALKFCLAEGGRRVPVSDHWSGIIASAVQMRLGEQARDIGRFKPCTDKFHVNKLDLWRWLMLAWLKEDSAPQPLSAADETALAGLRKALTAIGLSGWLGQVDAAVNVLVGKAPGADFFVPPPQESWRVALAALEAVAAPEANAAVDGGADSRMVWVLTAGPAGALRNIVPLEQKRGPRGWGKPKAITLAKLSKANNLLPADAAVARTVRHDLYERSYRVDLAAAAVALVGHPHIEFDDAPGVPVSLVEASPEIDVTQVIDQRRVRMLPGLHAMHSTNPFYYAASSPAEQKEAEALQSISVLRDSKQRARLIRLTPAHKRVAQLLGDGLLVPADGLPQLQQVLQGLGAHFQVHADEVQAEREVAPDARLRAELAPQGDGVSLRLVVAPLGLDGPRLAPGSGRSRLVAALGGETLGAQRDLAQERTHLEAVLDACPMLEPLLPGSTSEWLVDSVDDALALVEQLYALQAAGSALAALDWPAGKAIRVDTAALPQLQVQVSSASDWLGLRGGVTVDEGLVFSLAQMLDWSRSGKSRFIPLGEGRYLALTQELRTRLDELSAVAEVQRGETRVPLVAAAWLESVVDGAQVQADKAFGQRIKRLVAAQEAPIALPAGLQAQLRPYQEEGYQWAMRLAQAGLGACLADDMGLGKTLQALAVLLARATGGPALLVAPSSLMGNWLAEARRFAPSLQFQIYGEAEREGLIERLGPHDVLLVSYQLHQQNVDAFGSREWHTLVLDEAQAIKNAAAKRAQAVHDMRAAFRLALSGTPIENRLSELWSVMRVCNPGLLGSLTRFNERFAGPIERDRNRQAQRNLRRLIAPFVLRRTKAQVLDDLPPRTELTLTVEPDAAEQAHYEALRRQALEAAQESLSGGSAGHAQINILAQLTRLRRAACDPRLVSPQLGLVGAKVQAFGELAAELSANGHKALVFSQFVDFLSLLREPLDAAGIKYQYLDGSTPTAERTRRVAAFQGGEGDMFLISLKAGGFGLNLTMADYVVIADPWWNPAAEDQASGRAHRIGQQRPVTVYRLVNRGTLEERIVALHQSKRELADSVLEGGEVTGVLKADELVALMQGD